MKLQFYIYSLVKRSHFWFSVKTSEGSLRPQLRILVTVLIQHFLHNTDQCLPYKGWGKDDSPPNLPKNILVKVPSAREQNGHTQLLISTDNKHENICEFCTPDSSPHLLSGYHLHLRLRQLLTAPRGKNRAFTVIQNVQQSNYCKVLKGSLTLTYERQCFPC